MRTLARAGGLLAIAEALALPALALAQAQGRLDQPPGGVESAWPLGLIVLLVALVAVIGMLVSRRHRAGGSPRRS